MYFFIFIFTFKIEKLKVQNKKKLRFYNFIG